MRTRKESTYWNSLIDEYHYLGYKPVPGAQVRYLISWDEGDIGAIGFSASVWKVGVRDKWIGWDSSVREKDLRLIVNYSRFLVLPNVRVKNLASCILSLCASRLVIDFAKIYGYEPVLLETFEHTCLVAQYYLCRWQIEIYFKILKSGCKIEERQFETAECIKPCITLYMIVAMASVVCYDDWKGMSGFVM